jgi:hypothetical protein
MGNIMSYLKWRADETFMERPFCDADNLVFSELAYWNLKGIVPDKGTDGSVSLKETAEQLKQMHGQEESEAQTLAMIREMASSARFRDIRLSEFADVRDEEEQTEFAAVQIALGDGSAYVAFRGTGDYILGWREDFSMAFQVMGSQKLAAAYLEETMRPELTYRVGGHSKGGNLAIYASMMCPECKQAQIAAIYSNDGPGLCPDIIDMDKYAKIRDKVIRIVPEYCVIGTMFADDDPPDVIVESTEKGLVQHDEMSWMIDGDSFCRKDRMAKECRVYHQIFREWLDSASMEQRKIFVKDFFDALEAGGSKRFSELARGGFAEFAVILYSLAKSESHTKAVMGKFLKSFLGAFSRVQLAELADNKVLLQGVLLLTVGTITHTLFRNGKNQNGQENE